MTAINDQCVFCDTGFIIVHDNEAGQYRHTQESATE